MRRIDKILEECSCDRYVDVCKIRKCLMRFNPISNQQLESLWSEYSDSLCAGWMIVDEEEIARFEC